MFVIESIKAEENVPQINFGVDWLTVVGADVVISQWLSKRLAQDSHMVDCPPQYYKTQGRQLRDGTRIYGGLMDTEWVIVFSGKALHAQQSLVYSFLEELAALVLAGARFTRMDLALDAYDAGARAQKTAEYYSDTKHAQRKRKIDVVTSHRAGKLCGATVYEGSRQSDVYGRMYDKNLESGGDVATTRLEWELKGTLMKRWSAALKTRLEKYLNDDPFGDMVEQMQNAFRTEFKYHCETGSLGNHIWWPEWFYSGPHAWRLPLETVEQKSDSRRWIETSVWPTIEKDIRTRGGTLGSHYEWLFDKTQELLGEMFPPPPPWEEEE